MKKIQNSALHLMLILLTIANPSLLIAQTANTSSDFYSRMNSSGKIYVAIAVLSVILIGIFGYLISIDRKVRRLEEKDNS